jgi:acetyl/propionyl-CoA carboxylase alpha subunit
MPTPGTLSLFSIPERRGLRVDSGYFAGAEVPPYYDSLLAKLISHGDDRLQATEILIDALEEVDVEGVETNRSALLGVLGHPDFANARVTTDWLERAIR